MRAKEERGRKCRVRSVKWKWKRRRKRDWVWVIGEEEVC
jgi:hypothetical protein